MEGRGCQRWAVRALTPDCCVWLVTRGRRCFHLCNGMGSVVRRRGSVGGRLWEVGGTEVRGDIGHTTLSSVVSRLSPLGVLELGLRSFWQVLLAGRAQRRCPAEACTHG